MRSYPTSVDIDLSALRRNFHSLKERIGNGHQVLTVVKSNAYGHGAVPVARTLQSQGADLFGVGTVDEGIQLREAGIKRPILLLIGLIQDHFAELIRYQLTPVLYDLETARDLQKFLGGRGDCLDVHVKVDTGMTRLGVGGDELPRFLEELRKMPNIRPVGLVSHLADAGHEPFTKQQIALFERAKMEFQKRFPAPFCHLANSLASLDRKLDGNSGVRLGIVLYGAYPIPRQRKVIDLRPVMTWKTRIVSARKVPKGTPVSYGRTFVTKRPSKIGCVPVGYADGYPRLASNRSFVLVKGKRAPVVGTVCMDMLMVDLTKIPSAGVGDEVVLLGEQGSEAITAEELGSWANTISYEIFCHVAERVPRNYIDRR